MQSPFEYYLPPIFMNKEMNDEDKNRHHLFIKCLSSYISEESLSECDTVRCLSEPNVSDVEESDVEMMMVDDKDIGKVIGKGGNVISKIREESGAIIKIFDKRIGSKRKIKIWGNALNVKTAKNKITSRILMN